MIYKKCNDTEFLSLMHRVTESNGVYNNFCIAGGAAMRLWHGLPWTSNDVDFFFYNVDTFNFIKNRLELLDSESSTTNWYEIIFESHNAITFVEKCDQNSYRSSKLFLPILRSDTIPKYNIQLIRRKFYTNLSSVLDDFDLTICQYGFDGEYLWATDAAIKAFENKILEPTGTCSREINAARLIKYMIYGFYPSNNLLDVVANLCDSDQNFLQSNGNDYD